MSFSNASANGKQSLHRSGWIHKLSLKASINKPTAPRTRPSKSQRELAARRAAAAEGLLMLSKGHVVLENSNNNNPGAAVSLMTPPPSPSGSPGPSPSPSPPPPEFPRIGSFSQNGRYAIRIEQVANPTCRTSVSTGAQGQRVVRIESLPLAPEASLPALLPDRRVDAGEPRPAKSALEHFMEGDRHYLRLQLGA